MFQMRRLQCKQHQVMIKTDLVFKADGLASGRNYECPICGARATEDRNGLWLTIRRDQPGLDSLLVADLMLGDEDFPFEDVQDGAPLHVLDDDHGR